MNRTLGNENGMNTSASNRRFRFWLGIALSALFLLLALRNVAWVDVRASWLSARPWALMGGLILLVSSWMIAAVRWRLLLMPAPGLRVRDAFAYITIGYLANTVLPLRLGDLSRATLIGRNKGLGISRSLGSMALERVTDLLALLLFASALAYVMDIPPIIKAGVMSMTGLAAGALLVLIIMSANQRRLRNLTRILYKLMPQGVADRVEILVINFISGVAALQRPMQLSIALLLSLLVWLVAGAATCLWIYAFHLPTPWFAGFFVLVVVNLGSAIPSSPGYVGVYHYLAVLALSLWIPDRGPALAYALGTHALNMMANVSLGAYFLAREGISLQELRAKEQ